MKIKSIRAGVHRLAVAVPLLKDPITRNAVVCEVETDDGYVGSGLTGGAYLPFAIVTAIEKEFLPLLKDMDPRDTEAIHEKVWWRINQRSMTGVVSSALSTIDIACWDIHGKLTGRTVAQLLGGCATWCCTRRWTSCNPTSATAAATPRRRKPVTSCRPSTCRSRTAAAGRCSTCTRWRGS